MMSRDADGASVGDTTSGDEPASAEDTTSGDEPASAEDTTSADEPASPEVATADTFTLLSDETRVGVVRELAGADADSLGFSELRTRVGVRDGGRFNYHLQKLRGRLVEKTDGGYALTAAGERAAQFV